MTTITAAEVAVATRIASGPSAASAHTTTGTAANPPPTGCVAALLVHGIAGRTPLPFHLAIPPSADLAERCREYLAAPDVGQRALTRRFRAETGITTSLPPPPAWG
ncbi:hypothetical protein [Streptomyces sp. BRA346]|uniref:hypothetical protein n=1 Tax=Streptomyces sp. BRA346 TaxID=2878199 RepID=UPI0040648E99